jgi:hypothetical protein
MSYEYFLLLSKGDAMRAQIHKLLLLLVFAALALTAWATVSEYSFTSAMGTWTAISGGTVHGTAANDNDNFLAIPLGFSFTYNGVTYTEVSIQTNGFLAMGPTVATSNVAISSTTGTNNIVAALNRDIKSRDTGELMSLSSGTAPNRVFTVQWLHYRRVPTTTANDDFSFQIQLHENANKVIFVYGPFSTVTASTAATIQVGLRGDSNADFNNRTTTTDWSATTAGTANNSSCTLSATVFPASGLTFTFTPPTAGVPPETAQNPNPANSAINVPIGANLSWATGGGLVEGYRVYLGSDNPPTNIVNGTTQTGTSYDPADFNYNTTYYWQIVPFNTFGDAVNCPVWSFTTLADPTVTTYPYNQNFDTVTPPGLPLGWTTINANADSYTWESYAGNADTAPNSMRIRYNTTVEMNDWLVSPPMTFAAGSIYKVKFFYRANSATYPEKLSVYYGNAPTAAAMTNLIFENLNITNVTYNMVDVNIPITTSGNYYIGFWGHSAIDMFYLYMDTFSVSEVLDTLNPPTNLTATVQNNFNVHLAWQAPATRNLLGYKVYRDGTLINSITNPATLTYDDMALAVGTYVYTVTAIYDGGESVPTAPVSVNIVAPLNPPTDLTATVTGNDVVLNWTSPEAPPQGTWITWSQDVLGNSVGTNAAANFDVAHRWPAADIATYVGDTISQVKFVPSEANCVYTVKVWTGGSIAGPATLVTSQVVNNPTIDDWNLVVLNTPVVIPANSEVWVGYNCNTQAGYPAGCDSGPQIEGKGNMMYFQGTWSTLTALAPTLTYNWTIQTFVQTGTGLKAITTNKPVVDLAPASLSNGSLAVNHKEIQIDRNRALTGFKVYRDGVLIGTINNPTTTTFAENDLPNATYTYGVSATYTTGESVPATVQAVVNVVLAPAFFTETFETYTDFAALFAPWTLLDQDQSATYGIQNVEFPGSGGPMAYIIFNPSATTPAVTSVAAHGGAKMAASFASTTPPNNDWLITPRVHLGTNSAVRFYARSMSNSYLEDMRVGVSTIATPIPQGFQNYLTGGTPVQVPAAWTEYIFDLSAYDGQSIYLAIRNVSNDEFIFFVDDFTFHSVGGSVSNEDGVAPVIATELKGNYPNPFNPETTISYSVKENTPVSIEIFNVKGQKVTTLVNEAKAAGNHSVVWKGLDDNNRPVSSGIYYFKMNAGKYSSTKKMILMK